ncbi:MULTISPECIES: DUF3168 domain-containing protein [Stenotrophomonas]|uniref:tail completion protein gp17 n=1 Tax=Stenotrophomonas TaxID=40323 RepID=UPI000B72D9AA|nr:MULTISPECIES: DUF3168 domain-containing protein [Stenotrophomonas]SMR69250.1 Protein of unknown function [Stenotrophomonas sp. yr243]SNT58091.1 Protein of unknown function [Stenotrophomonas lactitubi]
MLPKVFRTIHTPAVMAIAEDRIARHGEIAQTEKRPYVVWQVITGSAFDNLSSAPGGDFTTVQIDCYHAKDEGVEQLANAVRAALDAVLIVNRVAVNNRDTETKLYRIGLEADFIDQR